jgi:hypothetical protein
VCSSDLSGSSSDSDSDSRDRVRRLRRRDASDSSSSDTSRSRGARRRRDRTRDRSADRDDASRDRKRAKKRAKKLAKSARRAAKKARARERKDAKRALKRAKKDEDDGKSVSVSRECRFVGPGAAPPGGLELRTRETVERERREKREAPEALVGNRETSDDAREKHEHAANDARVKSDAPAAAASTATVRKTEKDSVAANPPEATAMASSDVTALLDANPSGPAMTLEQYRAMVSQKTYMRGTAHATRDETAASESERKAESGWWSCPSYKCTAVLNPKFADRCSSCSAMKPLDAGANTGFFHAMTDAQYAANRSRRRGK